MSLLLLWGRDATAACLLCKQKVEGSNPFVSTNSGRLAHGSRALDSRCLPNKVSATVYGETINRRLFYYSGIRALSSKAVCRMKCREHAVLMKKINGYDWFGAYVLKSSVLCKHDHKHMSARRNAYDVCQGKDRKTI